MSAQPQPTGRAGKPGGGQRGDDHRRLRATRLQHGHTVDPLDQDRLDLSGADEVGQRGSGDIVGLDVVGEGQQRAAAALQEPAPASTLKVKVV